MLREHIARFNSISRPTSTNRRSDMPCLLEDTKYSAEKRRGDKVPLGFDDLGGVLLRVYNSNGHDRISLLHHSPGGRRSFLAAA